MSFEENAISNMPPTYEELLASYTQNNRALEAEKKKTRKLEKELAEYEEKMVKIRELAQELGSDLIKQQARDALKGR